MEAFVSQSAQAHLYSSAFGYRGKHLQQVTHVCTWDENSGNIKTSWYIPQVLKRGKKYEEKQ